MRSFETRKRSFAYDCTFKTFTSDITVTPGHRELQLLLLLALLMLSLPTTTAVITTVFFYFLCGQYACITRNTWKGM